MTGWNPGSQIQLPRWETLNQSLPTLGLSLPLCKEKGRYTQSPWPSRSDALRFFIVYGIFLWVSFHLPKILVLKNIYFVFRRIP